MTYEKIEWNKIEYPDSEQNVIQDYDFENILDKYVDKNGNFIYNLNETLYLNIDKNNMSYCSIEGDKHWTLISYKLYGTTRLWWLLCKINNVKNPMDIVESGKIVFFIKKELLGTLFNAMK